MLWRRKSGRSCFDRRLHAVTTPTPSVLSGEGVLAISPLPPRPQRGSQKDVDIRGPEVPTCGDVAVPRTTASACLRSDTFRSNDHGHAVIASLSSCGRPMGSGNRSCRSSSRRAKPRSHRSIGGNIQAPDRAGMIQPSCRDPSSMVIPMNSIAALPFGRYVRGPDMGAFPGLLRP